MGRSVLPLRFCGRGAMLLLPVLLAQWAYASKSQKDLGTELSCLSRATLWQRTAALEGREFCFLLDRARANLKARPELSLKWASRVSDRFPRSTAARAILGHALFLLEREAEAEKEFARLEQDGARAWLGADVSVLHLWAAARTATSLGLYQKAHLRYRQLLLALDALGSDEHRARALIEAACVSLFSKPDWAEPLSYLKRAVEENAPLLRGIEQGLREAIEMESRAPLERPAVQSPETLHGADDYWKMVWALGGSDDDPAGPELDLVFPAGAREWVLAKLAMMYEPDRIGMHADALACLHLPGHLALPSAAKGSCISGPEGEADGDTVDESD